jgi:hypothetical protein
MNHNEYKVTFVYWLKQLGFEFHPETVILNVDEVYKQASTLYDQQNAHQKPSRPKFKYSFWEGGKNPYQQGAYCQYVRNIGSKEIYYLTILSRGKSFVSMRSGSPELADELRFAEVVCGFNKNGLMSIAPHALSAKNKEELSLKTLGKVKQRLLPIAREKNATHIIEGIAFKPLWSANLPEAKLEKSTFDDYPIDYFILYVPEQEKPKPFF